MKRVLVIVAVLEIVCATATVGYSADYWVKKFGGVGSDIGYSIQETTDGGYILAGYAGSIGHGGDALILKLLNNGDINWQKSYGDNFEEAIHSIQQTPDGGYIAVGWDYIDPWAGDVRPYDALVLKLDTNGVISWQKSLGNGCGWECAARGGFDYANYVQQTSNGQFLIAGRTNTYGMRNNKYDLWLIKINGSGDVVWDRTYGGAEDDWVTSLEKVSNDEYIMSGTTKSYGKGGSDFWVMKLKENGDDIYIAWQKTYGGANDDVASSVQQTLNDGYIVAGSTFSFGAGDSDALVLRLDASGTIIWERTYGEMNMDVATSIRQTTDGGYIMTGYTNSFSNSIDVWLVKLYSNGDIEWEKTIGGTGDDKVSSIQQTPDRGYLLVGSMNSLGSSGDDFLILKLDEHGDIPTGCNYIKSSSSVVLPSSVEANNFAPDPNQTFASQYVSGSVGSSISSTGSLTLCFASVSDGDPDSDGIPDYRDNCPTTPNGPTLGTCTTGNRGASCTAHEDCGTPGYCSMNQEDTSPPDGNGVGDACDCEGDFNCDGDVDGSDAAKFKEDFGRSKVKNPCPKVITTTVPATTTTTTTTAP